MRELEILFLLMSVIIFGSLAANKLKLPSPILLMILGLGIGLLSGKALIEINPEIVFLIFLPPLLFEAAHNVSWHEFKEWRKHIFFLAIGLVIFTAFCIAVTIHFIVPSITMISALLLGAIVAPPDAVAATSVTKNLALPRHITTILEGESLVNDASSLILYQFALMTIIRGEVKLIHLPLSFILISGGGVIFGLISAWVMARLIKKLDDPTIITSISLLLPMSIYVAAEELHISGVLAVVSCGLYLSWYPSQIISFKTRFKMKEFWEVLIFLLNGTIFLLLGLQLPSLVTQFPIHELWQIIGYGLLISLILIVARAIWIFPLTIINVKLHNHKHKAKIELGIETYKQMFILSWAGMRGVVSLAIAMSLPVILPNGQAFPHRNAIILISFVVIICTLLLHGLTLPFIIRKLKLKSTAIELLNEEHKLRNQLLTDSLEFIDSTLASKYQQQITEGLKQQLLKELDYHKEHTSKDQELHTNNLTASDELIIFQRDVLQKLQNSNSYPVEIIRKVNEDIDILNLLIHSKLNARKEKHHI